MLSTIPEDIYYFIYDFLDIHTIYKLLQLSKDNYKIWDKKYSWKKVFDKKYQTVLDRDYKDILKKFNKSVIRPSTLFYSSEEIKNKSHFHMAWHPNNGDYWDVKDDILYQTSYYLCFFSINTVIRNIQYNATYRLYLKIKFPTRDSNAQDLICKVYGCKEPKEFIIKRETQIKSRNKDDWSLFIIDDIIVNDKSKDIHFSIVNTHGNVVKFGYSIAFVDFLPEDIKYSDERYSYCNKLIYNKNSLDFFNYTIT